MAVYVVIFGALAQFAGSLHYVREILTGRTKRDYDGKNVVIVVHKASQLALDVILRGMSWEEAFANDWRKTKSWRPGWTYIL